MQGPTGRGRCGSRLRPANASASGPITTMISATGSRIVRLCRDNGVRLTAVLSPLGPQTHAALDDADTEAVAERISRLAPVWDFRSAREPSNTPDMWPDPRHYRREVAAFMLARMYGGDLPAEWRNFGRRRP